MNGLQTVFKAFFFQSVNIGFPKAGDMNNNVTHIIVICRRYDMDMHAQIADLPSSLFTCFKSGETKTKSRFGTSEKWSQMKIYPLNTITFFT